MTERTPKMVTRIQMAPYVDAISDDLEFVGHKLPYPFYVDDDGYIQLQDLWQGKVYKVIGFQNHPAIQRIDLFWSDVKDPAEIVGKYLVTTDKDGQWSSFETAITEAIKTEAVV